MTPRLVVSLVLTLLLYGCGSDQNKVGFKSDPQIIPKQKVEALRVGSEMPSFKLISSEDRYYDSNELQGSKATLIVFLSNYCPTSQAYEERIIDLTKEFKDKGLRVVAISPNSPWVIPPRQLGYSDLSDDFESMVVRSKDQSFNFPYLYDGDDHKVSLQFGPTAIPHAFLFDADQILKYRGNIDAGERPGTANAERLRNAIEAVLNERKIIRAEANAFGCPVYWSWKHDEKARKDSLWNIRPVGLKKISLDSLKTLRINFGPRLRTINFWATSCGPCKKEYPELVMMQRMYGDRLFEFISVSLDSEDQFQDAFVFLQQTNSALPNFICHEPNNDKLASSIHPDWDGSLPFTIMLEPYGEVYRFWSGPIDPIEVRKAIVEHRLMGRYH